MPEKNLPHDKVIAVVGPTSSGKSELAVKLAKKFNGEIISVDSRQVYKGMDIGTGKVEGSWVNIELQPPPLLRKDSSSERRRTATLQLHSAAPLLPEEGWIATARRGGWSNQMYVYKSIPHHLIDFANPRKQYSVAQFQKQARKIIKDIQKRGKLPILCGGTGHWMDSVLFDQPLPKVKPNLELRKELEQKPVEELFKQLQKLDPERAKTIDPKNPRRLIRALEIILTTGKPVPFTAIHSPLYPTLWIGINPGQETLYQKIEKRLKDRLKQGMILEVENLHKTSSSRKIEKKPSGLSWEKLESFGLEYKYVSLYLQEKLTYDEMFEQLLFAIKHYAKRQMTWFKRNKSINWITQQTEAATLVKNFIKK